MQTVRARDGGGGGSQQTEVADGADVVFTDTVVADARERRLRSTASRTCVVTRTDITRPSAIEQHLTNDRRTPQTVARHYF